MMAVTSQPSTNLTSCCTICQAMQALTRATRTGLQLARPEATGKRSPLAGTPAPHVARIVRFVIGRHPLREAQWMFRIWPI